MRVNPRVCFVLAGSTSSQPTDDEERDGSSRDPRKPAHLRIHRSVFGPVVAIRAIYPKLPKKSVQTEASLTPPRSGGLLLSRPVLSLASRTIGRYADFPFMTTT
jgi:hypothetical protein